MVSQCSKASESDLTDGIQTDGYPVVTSAARSTTDDDCLDKRVNLYLPFPRPLDHGMVLVKIFEEIDDLPPFKIYGPEDSGKQARRSTEDAVAG